MYFLREDMKIQSDAWDLHFIKYSGDMFKINFMKLCQKSCRSVDFWRTYSKNIKGRFYWNNVVPGVVLAFPFWGTWEDNWGGGSHSGGAPHIILIKLCSWFRLNTSLLAVTPPCYWCHCHWLLLGHVAALARCGLLLQMSWCSVVRLSACVRACVRVCVCQSVGCCKTAEPTQTQLDPRNHLLHIWVYVPPRAGQWLLNFPARYLPAHKAHMPKTSSIRPAVSTEHRHETDTDRHMVIDIVPR